MFETTTFRQLKAHADAYLPGVPTQVVERSWPQRGLAFRVWRSEASVRDHFIRGRMWMETAWDSEPPYDWSNETGVPATHGAVEVLAFVALSVADYNRGLMFPTHAYDLLAGEEPAVLTPAQVRAAGVNATTCGAFLQAVSRGQIRCTDNGADAATAYLTFLSTRMETYESEQKAARAAARAKVEAAGVWQTLVDEQERVRRAQADRPRP